MVKKHFNFYSALLTIRNKRPDSKKGELINTEAKSLLYPAVINIKIANATEQMVNINPPIPSFQKANKMLSNNKTAKHTTNTPNNVIGPKSYIIPPMTIKRKNAIDIEAIIRAIQRINIRFLMCFKIILLTSISPHSNIQESITTYHALKKYQLIKLMSPRLFMWFLFQERCKLTYYLKILHKHTKLCLF